MAVNIEQRINGIDWGAHRAALDHDGYAVLPRLLSADECAALRNSYANPELFRSRIDMARYRFGRGEYQYFRYPLPDVVAELRANLYRHLTPVANDWAARLSEDERFPSEVAELTERCHRAGQKRPTPLLLKYGAGDFNCLHQDLYGDIVFPLQVVFQLCDPDQDFDGGELVLVEQQPRAQSIAKVARPRQGEAVILATRYRPVKGSRGYYRTNLKHGVSVIRSGERYTLGVIFHDAK